VEQAVSHLNSLGHEKIGLVLGPPDHVPSQRKLTTFKACVASLGLTASADLVEHGMFSIEGGHAATARLFARGVTAVLCASDLLALGAVRAARRQGLSVPSQFSVVGYDDSFLMNCTDPPLTTTRQPIEAMGRAVVELLVKQINGGSVTAEELLFAPELVVRGSTGRAVVTSAT
jgi:DNA-binding LacI/PurR family transcriptional regulator